MLRIDLRHEGRRITLPILIVRPEPSDLTHIEVTALLDTGANVSGIAGWVARKLDLNGIGKRPIVAAGGVMQAERYLFRIGLRDSSAGPESLPYVFEETLGFALADGAGLDAVLGMDVLKQCDFVMRRDYSCTLGFG